MDWTMFWALLGSLLGVLSLYSGFMIWFISRIENRLDAHMTDNRNEWMALNARIDTTQAIIMRMLEKQGR